MFFHQPQVKEKSKKNRNTHFLRRRFLPLVSLILALGTIYQIVVVLTLTQKNTSSPQRFVGEKWKNPYQGFPNTLSSEKLALHTHSNEVYFTPERHTVSEIVNTYQKFGFSHVAITDYGQITKSEEISHLTGFEWGQNIKKRHILALGARESFSDYFPIYASRENINWVINKLKSLGSYVIIPHPKLNGVYTREEIQNIDGFHAVEVYSPFGDDTKILDALLSQGKKVHCMANDDLHYFPEENIKTFDQPFWKDWIQTLGHQRGRRGESGQRFIKTLEGSKDQNAVMEHLFRGSFFCVKKFFREGEDPNLPTLQVENNLTLRVRSQERYLEIRFIGEGGEILQISPDTNSADYKFKESDSYVRLEIIGLTGSILSNAIYRN